MFRNVHLILFLSFILCINNVDAKNKTSSCKTIESTIKKEISLLLQQEGFKISESKSHFIKASKTAKHGQQNISVEFNACKTPSKNFVRARKWSEHKEQKKTEHSYFKSEGESALSLEKSLSPGNELATIKECISNILHNEQKSFSSLWI